MTAVVTEIVHNFDKMIQMLIGNLRSKKKITLRSGLTLFRDSFCYVNARRYISSSKVGTPKKLTYFASKLRRD